jgi:hypothetical protein
MRKLKRVGWFCFAGCYIAGLLLIGSEWSQQTKLSASDGTKYGSATYCPNMAYGQLGGIYWYAAYAQDVDCLLPTLYLVSDSRRHDTGLCGTCPDPIVSAGHPVSVELPAPSLAPHPDPLFSGVLR